MKRKAIKIGLIVVSALIVLVVIIALSISSIAKGYIEKHSKELIGRKVLMQKLHVNIFTGTLAIDSVRMYEKDDKQIFASIDSFYMHLTLHKLISSKVEMTEIKVIRPYAQILQNGDKFNFDDLMPKENQKNSKKSSFPKSIVIKNIYIRGGRLVYTDQQLHNTIKMNDLGVAIPELCLEQGNTNAGINLKIGDASLQSKLILNMQTNDYQVSLLVKNLPLSTFSPYMREKLNIDKFEGKLNTDFKIIGNKNHIMDFTLSGTADAMNVNLTNSSGEPLISSGNASVKIEKIYLPTSTYLFDYIRASNVDLSFIMKPAKNNYTSILKPSPSDTVASTPMTVKIKELRVTDSRLTFTDKTLAKPFSLPMRKVDFQADNFDMNGVNDYTAKAILPEGGKVAFRWKGSMNDLSNQQISVSLQNMSLRLLSPYCLQYTAYDITEGNLNFTSKNSIRNYDINSTNQLDAFKFNVGKKHKEMKPAYNVPLKLALYILKDKDDKIQFDVPVKGNIHDPKFSYSKIIFQTIVNLMVKIAISPVRFLAGALGMNADKMESLDINALQTEFSAEQYKHLNDLASILKQKPDMALVLTQYVDTKDVLPDYSLYKAKEAYLISTENNDNKAHQFTYDEVTKVKDDDSQFMAYLNNLVNGKVPDNASLQTKVNALYATDSIQNGLQHFMGQRDEMLKNYMITSYEIPVKNLTVKTADKPTLDSYTGKAYYKIEMNLPGAEDEKK